MPKIDDTKIIFNSSSDPKLLSTNIPLGKILIFPPWQLNILLNILAISPLQECKIFMTVVEIVRQITMVTCSLPMVGGNWGCMGPTGGVPESPLSSWSTTIPQHESKPLQRGENTTRDVHQRGYNFVLFKN